MRPLPQIFKAYCALYKTMKNRGSVIKRNLIIIKLSTNRMINIKITAMITIRLHHITSHAYLNASSSKGFKSVASKFPRSYCKSTSLDTSVVLYSEEQAFSIESTSIISCFTLSHVGGGASGGEFLT